ncbi:plasmid pRiA4b ORF-3 family protein [Actinophytocola glycyrrhizae]|uniref:Plasmid pRiA4b ORF-3 family protein n=1 Tax=Actinophytocola glycyrrhizae TaxID=2044873 RepID=A0ABV9S4Z2_9PSEU
MIHWAGLQALLEVEAGDTLGSDPRVTALVTLTEVTEHQLDDERVLRHRVEHVMHDRGDWTYRTAPQRHGRVHPVDGALAVLRLFGAVEGTRLTPLGVWVESELRRVVPPQITPGMSVSDLLGLLADADEIDAWNRARRWFGDRTRTRIVTELVEGAAEASPAERVAAVGLIGDLGDEAVAAFRAAERFPNLAAHVRALAYQAEQAPPPSPEDLVWLATEYAHIDLVRHGAATARYAVMNLLDAAGIDRIADSGHPHAEAVAEALASVAGTPVPVQRLKVSLSGKCWRTVLLAENATLGLLHQVITVLFGWDDDHLHVFTVGHRRYADPFHRLEETGDEDAMPLFRALPQRGAKISHTYDMGACWQHEIVLEKVLDDHPLPYPECVAGTGDNPIEYYDPDDPEEPSPFDIEAVDKRLRKLVADH